MSGISDFGFLVIGLILRDFGASVKLGAFLILVMSESCWLYFLNLVFSITNCVKSVYIFTRRQNVQMTGLPLKVQDAIERTFVLCTSAQNASLYLIE